jgi:hypothetical protein
MPVITLINPSPPNTGRGRGNKINKMVHAIDTIKGTVKS